MVLPAVAYLEMARAAGELSGMGQICEVKNVVWSRPFVLDVAEKNISVRLRPDGQEIIYEIFSRQANEVSIHSQGRLAYNSLPGQVEPLDISAIQSRCTHTR